MGKHFDVVIVGGGHGGSQAATALRMQGFEGTIAIVGKERLLPYERPPLSKEYLAREKTFDRILIRPEKFWAEKDVELLLGKEVLSIDAAARQLSLADGEEISYGDLIWSAGGTPRKLTCAGHDLAGLHSVRDKADVDRIMAELDAGASRVVVIGGGYIGLEAAAVLTKLGCEVILLEALDRVLARVAGEALSRFFEQIHLSHGVDLRLGARVDCVVGEEGKAKAVRLADGETIPCDMVIVGIGIEPRIAPLREAGATISNGVEIDENCRTSLDHIYAIGDCAAHTNDFADGAMIRLESVQNAADMALVAAKAICKKPDRYHALPWFWSNQYDIKLQTVGLSQGHDETVLRGDPESGSFSVVYLKGGVVIALDCVNAMRDFVQGKKLVEAQARPTIGRLADCATPLKELLLTDPA